MSMRGKPRVFIDQHGLHVYARTVRELREKSGGGRVSRMYIDMKNGKTLTCGYVVGYRWFSEYAPVLTEVR